MRPRGRARRVCSGVCAAVLFAAAPAHGDPAVERRVAALRALIAYGPVERQPAPPPVERVEGPCTRDAWWRHSEHFPRKRVARAIREAALQHGVPSRLIRSVIRHESNFAIDAVSHRGALGLMQLMPATAEILGVRCPFDPRENILAGTRYLREQFDRFGTWQMALLAYNAGPTRVAEGRIPRESRVYAQRVLHTWSPQRYPAARG